LSGEFHIKRSPIMTTVLNPTNESRASEAKRVTNDVAYLRTVLVNVFFIGPPGAGDREWVLVDAGISGAVDSITQAAEMLFSVGSRPAAIILTHGHFDHVGSLEQLAERWDAPVYVHPMELPYVTGQSSYPPTDPSVGGGLIAALSWSFPRGPIDIGDRANPLPEDMTVPGLPEWRWVFTPGHTPGHIALFRDSDRTLIAGDAVITTKLESAHAVMTQRCELHGPPMYYTTDWPAAAKSVSTLADLEPEIVVTGHGEPMQGTAMRADLHALARDFYLRAMPKHGRYVTRPATADLNGVVALPPDVSDLVPGLLIGSGGVAKFVKDLLGDDAVGE
jgi:glyoxylase-like metal-dependent hydrolase (beta-lactamase superfamily II)